MILTLITDFGTADSYAGVMKGVILSRNPEAVIVDITHEVEPGNIREAAFKLASAYRYFPKGSVHIAVVDPGVGSGRRIVCASAHGRYFVAPDNGILTPVYADEKDCQVRAVENGKIFLKPVSNTFHGRDIMAPAAASLVRKSAFTALGPPVRDPVRLDWARPKLKKNAITGEILHIDGFGNCITNIQKDDLEQLSGSPCQIRHKSRTLAPLVRFYAEAAEGKLCALMGSSGYLEIAAHKARADLMLKASVGDEVTAEWK